MVKKIIITTVLFFLTVFSFPKNIFATQEGTVDCGTDSTCNTIQTVACIPGCAFGQFECGQNCPSGDGDGGWTCFPAGTGVLMEDGSEKNIESVVVGEKVVSQSENGDKSISTVTELDQPIRDHMCQISFTNGEKLKLTDEHPLFTKDGWKSINPKNSYKDVPSLPVFQLQKGDRVIKSDQSEAEVNNFACWSEKVQTYNLILDGGVNTYFANGYLAHNKGLEWYCPAGTHLEYSDPPVYQTRSCYSDCEEVCTSCFPAGTDVALKDGGYEDIEKINIGDEVVSQSESGEVSISKVEDIEKPIRDHMCQIDFSDGLLLRVTDEHPLFSTSGWKAINAINARSDTPDISIADLVVGDRLIKEGGKEAEVTSIGCWSEKVQAYNLKLEGEVNTYFAEGVLAHNKKKGAPKCWYECTTICPTQECLHTSGCQPPSEAVVIGSWPWAGPGYPSGCLVAGDYACRDSKPGTDYCQVCSCEPDVPAVSCTIDLLPSSATVEEQDTLDLVATVTPQNGTVDQVNFSSSDSGLAGVSPASDTTSSYDTTILGNAEGFVTITAEAVMGGAVTCTDTSNITVTPIPDEPWWQVIDGDVVSFGAIASIVPLGNVFINDGLGGFPGLPVFATTLNTNSNPVSSTLWAANSQTSLTRLYDYLYFSNLVPDDVVFEDASVTPLDSGGTTYHGYYWYKSTSGLNITSDVNLGDRKVILLVEGGDININANINLNDGAGFLLAIADEDINIDPTLTGSPALEGLYITDGIFSSGAGTEQLYIRGSIAAYGGFSLQRDLADDTSPGEVFEYAPDQILLFPSKLSARRTRWNEIAP